MTTSSSFMALQGTMLNALASNAPLSETMYMLCTEVERLAPELHACILRLDGQLMRPLASPSMPDSYNEALNEWRLV